MITIKLDVNKIDKSRLFKGEKGTYLNLVLFDNRDGQDQWGNDGFVTQEISKEEREAGEKGAILGNWKTLGKPKSKQAPSGNTQRRRPEPEDSDCPF